MKKAIRAIVLAITIALGLLTSCGHGNAGRTTLAPNEGATPSATTQNALAQLDAHAKPNGVDAELWSELKGALRTALQARADKIASTPPSGEINRINDLAIINKSEGAYSVAWHYRNLGDYNQNGVVEVEDITPLAQHYGETYHPVNEPNCIQAVIDADGNGKLDIASITPIAMCFMANVHRYQIERADTAEGTWLQVGEIEQSAGIGEGRLKYVFDRQAAADEWIRVVAVDAEGNLGLASNAVEVKAILPTEVSIIEVSPTGGTEGTEDTFSASVTGNSPLSYTWNFGGGAIPNESNEVAPTVTFGNAGAYAASLKIENDYGSAVHEFTLIVGVDPAIPPLETIIRAINQEGPTPLQVTCYARVLSGTPPYEYLWDIGNDGTWDEAGIAFAHDFSEPGAYGIRLRVADGKGRTDYATALVRATGGSPGRGDWSVFGREPKHQRRSPFIGPQAPSIKWQFSLGDNDDWPLFSEAVFSNDGTLYIAGLNGVFYALNPDGTEKWQFPMENVWGDPKILSTAAVGEDGTIYIAGLNSYFYALTPSGDVRWKNSSAYINFHPTIGPDGTVYDCCNNTLWAYWPDGKWRWYNQDTFSFPTDLMGPALGDDGTIYVYTDDQYVAAFHPDGDFYWEYDINSFGDGSMPAIGSDGAVYIGSSDGNLYAFEADGTFKWTFPVWPWVINTVAIAEDGTIYISASEYGGAFLFALNQDGSLKWKTPRAFGNSSSPTVGADGKIYVADENAYCVTPDGVITWSLPLDNHVLYANASIGPDGTLYVVDGEGMLYAIGD